MYFEPKAEIWRLQLFEDKLPRLLNSELVKLYFSMCFSNKEIIPV